MRRPSRSKMIARIGGKLYVVPLALVAQIIGINQLYNTAVG